ncbi:MAG TPA: SDR family oxidoreductase [Solirubrobacteraceae bacterium]|jgi:NAD(P)-dependent dehydrogenase (short-subunit alcohol dehydrogenase family)/thioester reductase-like protein|nr:SDR family oxidoreductase [Solirubrobacteraceae bacterium]
MAYFVTGATGFIGSNLIPLLLERAAGKRGAAGHIHLLVRESSLPRMERRLAGWTKGDATARKRLKPVVGDLHEPLLGVAPEAIAALSERGIAHVFHLAAIYDMTAGAEVNQLANIEGTHHALELADAIGARLFHHVSSVAVAGQYRGVFTEDMFDVGQPLEHPYHRTKFESEKLVRETATMPWRVYRPSIVVGDSRTGRMEKVDGPYYFLPLLRRAQRLVPDWLPLIGPELGSTNIVPVDFVARALDHIAHEPGGNGQAFHLTDPNQARVVDVLNTFAKVAGAPQFAVTVDAGPLSRVPRGIASAIMALPGAHAARHALLAEVGVPDEIVDYIDMPTDFDTTRARQALAGSGIEVPPLESYADKLWSYWKRHLDPELLRHRTITSAVSGKTVLITGASSGIGKATALLLARSGATVLLVARGVDQLEETCQEITADDGCAYMYPADISDPESVDALIERVQSEHPSIDVLVNNAGRSIRRSIALSYDRFHDFERTMQLNYLGTIRLIMGLLPRMREQRSGHVINISSIGVQTNPPRFSAYVASKSALDAWTRVVSSECIADNVHFTTVHMPLVKTPMIAPTKLYDRFPTITPEQAAELIAEAIRTRPKTVNTTLGTVGEVSYALFPKLVDQVLSSAYKIFPDSAAARGQRDPAERASTEQALFAKLMRGVHW